MIYESTEKARMGTEIIQQRSNLAPGFRVGSSCNLYYLYISILYFQTLFYLHLGEMIHIAHLNILQLNGTSRTFCRIAGWVLLILRLLKSNTYTSLKHLWDHVTTRLSNRPWFPAGELLPKTVARGDTFGEESSERLEVVLTLIRSLVNTGKTMKSSGLIPAILLMDLVAYTIFCIYNDVLFLYLSLIGNCRWCPNTPLSLQGMLQMLQLNSPVERSASSAEFGKPWFHGGDVGRKTWRFFQYCFWIEMVCLYSVFVVEQFFHPCQHCLVTFGTLGEGEISVLST